MYIRTSANVIPTLKSDAQMKLIEVQTKAIRTIGMKMKDYLDPSKSQRIKDTRKQEILDLTKKIKISPRLPHQLAITASTHEVIAQALSVSDKNELEAWVKSKLI